MEKMMMLPTLQTAAVLFAFLTLAPTDVFSQPPVSDEDMAPTEAGKTASIYYSLRGI